MKILKRNSEPIHPALTSRVSSDDRLAGVLNFTSPSLSRQASVSTKASLSVKILASTKQTSSRSTNTSSSLKDTVDTGTQTNPIRILDSSQISSDSGIKLFQNQDIVHSSWNHEKIDTNSKPLELRNSVDT